MVTGPFVVFQAPALQPEPMRLSRLLSLTSLSLLTSFTSTERTRSRGDRELHVMAFNVLFRGANNQASLDAIALEAPEVLCLTEFTPTFVRAFEARFSTEYPHRHFAPHTGTWGVGLASNYPLTAARAGPVAPSRIPDMQASVQLRGRPVMLDCVHLQPPLGKHRKNDDTLTTIAKNAAVREGAPRSTQAVPPPSPARSCPGDRRSSPSIMSSREASPSPWSRPFAGAAQITRQSLLAQRARLDPVLGLENGVPLLAQDGSYQRANAGFVFDQQDGLRASRHGAGP